MAFVRFALGLDNDDGKISVLLSQKFLEGQLLLKLVVILKLIM